MEHIYNDIDFINIIEEVLNNKYFKKTQSTIHHGMNKLDHSIKVSYYSYIYAKRFNLDYVSVARGGIMHDFYYSTTNGKSLSKDSAKLTFTHSKISLENSIKYFNVNEMEKDIIVKHMFRVNSMIPKYKESLLVALVDKVIGSGEFLLKAKSLMNFKVLAKVIPSFILLFGTLK